MPGGDRKGSEGMGPMTGRGLGFCAGNDAPGSARLGRGAGRGFGGGRGRGRGMAYRHGWRSGSEPGQGWRRRRYDPAPAFETEPGRTRLSALEESIERIRIELANLLGRIGPERRADRKGGGQDEG